MSQINPWSVSSMGFIKLYGFPLQRYLETSINGVSTLYFQLFYLNKKTVIFQPDGCCARWQNSFRRGIEVVHLYYQFKTKQPCCTPT